MKLLYSIIIVLLVGTDRIARDADFGEVVELAEKQAQKLDVMLQKIISQVSKQTGVSKDSALCRLNCMRSLVAD